MACDEQDRAEVRIRELRLELARLEEGVGDSTRAPGEAGEGMRALRKSEQRFRVLNEQSPPR